MGAGARLAEPGEFTLRAFLNGRINLVQAEAVRDLIDAVTPLQARAAFDQLQGTLTQTIGEIDSALFDLIARLEASVDFPDEGYHFVEPGALASTLGGLIERADRLIAAGARGRIVREGVQVAIVGKPNVGKSSVFNALVGTSRAIVTDVPGTTRDLVTEVVELEGLRVTFVDTAGLRQTTDRVEAEGVERARQAEAVSDVILIVLDGSAPLDESDRSILSQAHDYKSLIVKNKADLDSVWSDDLCGIRVRDDPGRHPPAKGSHRSSARCRANDRSSGHHQCPAYRTGATGTRGDGAGAGSGGGPDAIGGVRARRSSTGAGCIRGNFRSADVRGSADPHFFPVLCREVTANESFV